MRHHSPCLHPSVTRANRGHTMYNPNDARRPDRAGAATASSGYVHEIATHTDNGDSIPIGEQLMQVDQAITLTLQEVDANFAKTHQMITSHILPAVKRYGVASHNTWQGAKFWQRFFETASDINLAPPRGEADDSQKTTTEGDASTVSNDKDETALHNRSVTTDGTPQRRRGPEGGYEESGPDDSDLFDVSRFEPPRLSDASVAATARLSRPAAHPTGKTERLERSSSADENCQKDDRTSIVNARAQYDVNDGSSRYMERTQSAATVKAQATPRRGAYFQNPFTGARNAQQQNRRTGADSRSSSGSSSSPPSRWNGIADLRRTPLRKEGKRAVRSMDEEDDSLAWPAGMSPPVTMQFSVPRSRYNKTPAKEAARLVVDDLLRTVEGATPAARRRRLQERDATSSTSHGRIGSSAQPLSSRPDRTARGLAGTPLSRAKVKPTKGRQSMPTPPTVTKRVTRASRLPQQQQQQQQQSTPEVHGKKMSKPDSPLSSAARLMDEDEEGQSLMVERREAVGEGQHLSVHDLNTGLNQLVLDRPAPSSLDRLLSPGPGEDEDDSDNDLEDESESDEDDGDHSRTSTAAGTGQCSSARSRDAAPHATSSTITSVSHSIDEDTLFGIRDPAFSNAGNGSASVSKQSASQSSQRASSIHSAMPSISTAVRSDNAHGELAIATPSTLAYKPMGDVGALGTANRGRPLLAERDDTYSAPSPTPAGASAAQRH